MALSFAGWIPTVSGALSFTTFGEVSHPPRSISVNRNDGQSRYLLVYRGRDYSDSLLPFKTILAPVLTGLRGKLWFLCIARAKADGLGDQGTLEGSVFVFSDKTIWRNNVQTRVNTVQYDLKTFRLGVDGNSLTNAFDSKFHEITEYCYQHSAFNVQFVLYRNGITRIDVQDPPRVSATAPRLPADAASRSHIVHILASQAFFFLRDVGHRHQHHNPSTDTIVDLYPYDPLDPDQWMMKTLYALYRKVISYKRLRYHSAFAASMGVLAYADTFRGIVESHVNPETKKRLPLFYTQNVLQSINAVGAHMERESSAKTLRTSVTRELMLGILALLVAVMGVFQITEYKIDERPSEYLFAIGTALTVYPAQTLATTLVLIWCLRIPLRHMHLSEYRVVNYVFRFTQVLDLRWAILVFLSIGLALLSIAYGLVLG